VLEIIDEYHYKRSECESKLIHIFG